MVILYKKEGFSILEVIVVIGIMSIIALGISMMSNNMSKEISSVRALQSRDRLNMYISSALSNKKSIETSMALDAASNNKLQDCLLGNTDTTILCSAEDVAGAKIKNPFKLYPPNSTTAISGALGTPLAFGTDGAPCVGEAVSEKCPFSVETWFVADCGTGIKTCLKALDVSFFYEIKKNFGASIKSYNNFSMPISWSTINITGLASNSINEDENEVDASTLSSVPTFSCMDTRCCLYIKPKAYCKATATDEMDFSALFGKWEPTAIGGVGPTIERVLKLSSTLDDCSESRDTFRRVFHDELNQVNQGICGSIMESCVAGTSCVKIVNDRVNVIPDATKPWYITGCKFTMQYNKCVPL